MFTDQEKAEIDSLISEPFNSFKEPITVYRTPQFTYISTDPNFNFAYGVDQPGANTPPVPVSGQFDVTIQYLDSMGADQIYFPESNAPLGLERNFVRIGASGDAKDFLDNSEKIVIDGENFTKITAGRPRGMFKRNLYDYYFKKTT